jgi:predicted nucleotidyltransferase component of viral defense system
MKISKNLFPYFKQQIQVLEFLQKHIFSKIPKEFKKYYAFGGGTALSLCYFHHRLSFDVDIFIYPNSAKKTSSIIFNLEEDEFALA